MSLFVYDSIKSDTVWNSPWSQTFRSACVRLWTYDVWSLTMFWTCLKNQRNDYLNIYVNMLKSSYRIDRSISRTAENFKSVLLFVLFLALQSHVEGSSDEVCALMMTSPSSSPSGDCSGDDVAQAATFDRVHLSMLPCSSVGSGSRHASGLYISVVTSFNFFETRQTVLF